MRFPLKGRTYQCRAGAQGGRRIAASAPEDGSATVSRGFLTALMISEVGMCRRHAGFRRERVVLLTCDADSPNGRARWLCSSARRLKAPRTMAAALGLHCCSVEGSVPPSRGWCVGSSGRWVPVEQPGKAGGWQRGFNVRRRGCEGRAGALPKHGHRAWDDTHVTSPTSHRAQQGGAKSDTTIIKNIKKARPAAQGGMLDEGIE
ncbi:hypothetical protein HPB47_019592 [Ixodes persulcatus]|uniref:Uncharacterized protein n=1 Tax=Ixodes persulcatus TaxID=34615 RepID=A0AC60QHQ4_IXOPE|nr:hypothetical protein HPB47_019592 [Ixodes persulcatus]